MLHSQYIPIATKAHPKHWRLSGQLNTYNASSRLRHLAIGAGLLILAAFLYSSHFTKHFVAPLDLDQPPTYEKLWKWERDLPQHNLDLPFPEGRTGRYVLFKNQVQMLGWNNHLNEILMNAHLAYKSGRAYVFQDYIWKPDYYPWPQSKFRISVPHTPLNALMSGPAAGGPWDPEDPAPRSVSEKWFDIVCPKSERRIINTRDVKPAIYWENGDVIFEHWEKLLKDAPERCIEVQAESRSKDGFPQTFDLYLWGSSRVLPLWESFKNSPVSRLLATSPIVQSAVDRNEYLFLPRGPRVPRPATRDPYDRMLAIHLRRGDFKEACGRLATWNSTFYSWNLHPFLPDSFTPPPGGEWGKNTPENEAIYMERCLPTDEAIIKKIRDSRADYLRASPAGKTRTLDTIFLLTNDKSDWLERLKVALRKEGWYTIATTWDLELDQEQKDVGMAVDMDIARKAAVFIGNGWSSFTSNILHRRLVDGKEPISNRFY
ncbi:uncharacterized protein LACBIDRAFT_308809 [Laccaria bicolor S238N-H82]|uniref:Predicted protein n=1 Tax=Laccaria bicolor (strain S238N-H82 / ATCC MYA-4686) TaxID=486041 RepID=B0CX94_LACBS|nr:uncharacterized protein LACBIDRAFT_308809 [Laccaria bicolor S238N-H82]EDR13635.1 predicted protein [Laccaria bicolor S238N-H82]|eukprot:XP_001876133.1 predicted protein [Laccaria bicolor S238N-H82]